MGVFARVCVCVCGEGPTCVCIKVSVTVLHKKYDDYFNDIVFRDTSGHHSSAFIYEWSLIYLLRV